MSWSLKGKGLSCYEKTTIEVTGERILYPDDVIETLRQKLIETLLEQAKAPCGGGQIFWLDAKRIINKLFGVKE